MKYVDEYRNSDAATFIAREIRALGNQLASEGKTANIMEVCGSHTTAIARYAIRDLLPENIRLISGPGCPVCVSDSGYIDTAIDLSKKPDVIISTFGDMINVPGSEKTLSDCRTEGAHIEICYSPTGAIETALKNPNHHVIFLAIGFETTIAPVISLVEFALKKRIHNLSLLTAFKLIPPALEMLSTDPEIKIDAFLCPAHVSAIIGVKAYEPVVKKHRIPCVIASFEPVDILLGIKSILLQLVNKKAQVENQYQRVVKYEGNLKAREIIRKYLKPTDATWRGIGMIPLSGMKLKKEFSDFNTEEKLGIDIKKGSPDTKCRCGDVLKGKILPSACPLFDKTCKPQHPVGPCMVSSEGSCAAFYKYSR